MKSNESTYLFYKYIPLCFCFLILLSVMGFIYFDEYDKLSKVYVVYIIVVGILISTYAFFTRRVTLAEVLDEGVWIQGNLHEPENRYLIKWGEISSITFIAIGMYEIEIVGGRKYILVPPKMPMHILMMNLGSDEFTKYMEGIKRIYRI